MSLLSSINLYCERTNEGMWAEPINTISNLSFFIAAWLIYQSSSNRETRRLALLIALVGVGSTLFHLFGTYLTMLMDVVPIAIFVFYYLWVGLRHLLGFTDRQTVLALVIFTLAGIVTFSIPDPYRFNGSISYFPCLVAVLLIAWRLPKADAARRMLTQAGLLLAVSLTFRSIDILTCPSLVIGTHFLWHLLNGVVLYILAKALLCHCAPRQTV